MVDRVNINKLNRHLLQNWMSFNGIVVQVLKPNTFKESKATDDYCAGLIKKLKKVNEKSGKMVNDEAIDGILEEAVDEKSAEQKYHRSTLLIAYAPAEKKNSGNKNDTQVFDGKSYQMLGFLAWGTHLPITYVAEYEQKKGEDDIWREVEKTTKKRYMHYASKKNFEKLDSKSWSRRVAEIHAVCSLRPPIGTFLTLMALDDISRMKRYTGGASEWKYDYIVADIVEAEKNKNLPNLKMFTKLGFARTSPKMVNWDTHSKILRDQIKNKSVGAQQGEKPWCLNGNKEHPGNLFALYLDRKYNMATKLVIPDIEECSRGHCRSGGRLWKQT